jgi:hypothetical protein
MDCLLNLVERFVLCEETKLKLAVHQLEIKNALEERAVKASEDQAKGLKIEGKVTASPGVVPAGSPTVEFVQATVDTCVASVERTRALCEKIALEESNCWPKGTAEHHVASRIADRIRAMV